MADPARDEDVRPRSARRLLFIAAGVALAFLVGFGWQFVEARGYRAERDEARRELEFQRLATTLAAAVIQADRGSYEGARDLASRFFTGLQQNVEEADPAAREDLRDILSRRDAVITSLSRSDPSSEDVLTQMFVRYRVATGGTEIGVPIPAGEGAPPGADTGGGPGGP